MHVTPTMYTLVHVTASIFCTTDGRGVLIAPYTHTIQAARPLYTLTLKYKTGAVKFDTFQYKSATS